MRLTWKWLSTLPALLAALAVLIPSAVSAQQYPSRNIHFICGFPAGTGADTIVRYYAEKLKALTGHTVIVENRQGAGANIAIEYVARSKPDGHTILVHGGSGVASNMHLYKKPPAENVNQLQVFATINRQAFMLSVPASSPYKTVAELTEGMKKKGDKATYGSGAPASIILGAMYKTIAGLQAVEVNYKTSADMMADMLGGAVDYSVTEPIFSMGQYKQGKLRILAVSSAKRLNAAPELPTMIEAGVPGASMNLWWAGIVPAATPKPIVEQLNKWFDQITATEETKKFLNGFASDPWIISPAEAQKTLEDETRLWGGYMRIAKIEPQG